MTILWSRCLDLGNVVKVHGLVEDVVVEMIVEVVVDLLQTLAEST
jgi:hypothetical protein